MRHIWFLASGIQSGRSYNLSLSSTPNKRSGMAGNPYFLKMDKVGQDIN